jgi:HTH-type transcriptional regulator, global nitrogen regulator NrpRI
MTNMIGQEIRNPEGKLLAILKTLSDSPKPLGSYVITRKLKQQGIFINERTVRYHLKMADTRGYTLSFGRGGRQITDEGRQEIREALAAKQVGSIANKLKLLAYQTTFDPARRTGQVPVNISLVNTADFGKALSAMGDAFKAGLCTSELVANVSEGERVGSIEVPQGKTGLVTVCSNVIIGVLLKAGIPTDYKFGGMLEVKDTRPHRFIAIMDYEGTSLDPSEEFISSHITNVGEASRTGNGKVLAVFRTIPLAAREAAAEKIAMLKEAGIGGVFATGVANEPLCQVSVELNRFGMVLLNGLNPVAAAVESGLDIDNFAGSCMIDYQQLQPFWKLQSKEHRARRSHYFGE